MRDEARDLRGADLSYEYFVGTDFAGWDLTFARLVESDFSRSNLSGADLSGANLFGTLLHDADLSRARLVYTNFSRAVVFRTLFWGAHVSGANFSDVYGLRQEQLSGMRFYEGFAPLVPAGFYFTRKNIIRPGDKDYNAQELKLLQRGEQ